MNYLITIVLSLFGVFFALSRPRWGVVFILGMLYFPIFSLFNLGPVDVSISTLPVLALFGNAWWKWGRNSHEKIKIAPWQWLIMIGMVISMILSTIASQSPARALSILPNQILYVLIIFSISVLCRSYDDFVVISKAILIFVLIDGIWPGLPPIQQFFGERAMGINGIVFKYYIAFAISIVLVLQPVSGFSRNWRFVAFIVPVLVVYRAIVYESRSALLAIAMIMVLGFIRLPRRIMLLGIAIISILIGAVFYANVMVNNALATQRAIDALQSNNRDMAISGDRIRFVSNRFGWEMFQERPILGWGPGVFSDLMKNNISGPTRYVLGRAFNSWLLLIVENGLVGFIPFLLAFVIPFGIIWMNFNKNSTDISYLTLAFALGVLATGLHLVFIDLMYTSQVWFHVGLSMTAVQLTNIKTDTNISLPPVSRRIRYYQARSKTISGF
jgi:O-antigen ligase